MYKYNCLNVMREEALKLFPKDFERSEDMASDVILVRSTNMLEMKELPKEVKIIGRAGIGVNTIPFKEYAKQGIVVVNTPGGNANGVKELAIMAMIMAQRNIMEAVNWVHSLSDNPGIVEEIEKKKTKYTGLEVQGKTLGVIGLGAIGGRVANMAIELGLDVIGYDPYISIEHAWGLSKHIQRVESLEEIYQKSDIITVHTPLYDETKWMLSKPAFDQMKDGVIVLNFARAALVKDEDMLEALKSGKVARYMSDFPNPISVQMPNTIITPHIGGATNESETNCTRMAVKQTTDFILNGNIINSVNYPDVNAGRCMAKQRVTICHLNQAGMISQFTNVLKGNNIAKMFNNSLEDIAYTIFDLDNTISDEDVKNLEALDGVIRVRVLDGLKK